MRFSGEAPGVSPFFFAERFLLGARIDEALVRHIAMRSRLNVTDAELSRFASELSSVFTYLDLLAEVDTQGVPPTEHVLAALNVLRADEVRPSLGPQAVLGNAPQRQDTFFRVPKVLDQDSA